MLFTACMVETVDVQAQVPSVEHAPVTEHTVPLEQPEHLSHAILTAPAPRRLAQYEFAPPLSSQIMLPAARGSSYDPKVHVLTFMSTAALWATSDTLLGPSDTVLVPLQQL